ncbi:hypothetical protein CASFOL_019731 [Castilleja foliolosa]|uniref:F-box domain-containing protein n=1 Tax=Castilleja foliolosa TaxID=1961234 RepID=A0ABD3D1K7_9LAMI
MAGALKDNNPTAGGPSSAPWINLPRELTANILRRLGPVEILSTARKVCTTWRSVCSEPSMWRVIHMESSCEVILKFRSHILPAHEYEEFERSRRRKLSEARQHEERDSIFQFEQCRFHHPLCCRAVDLSQGELIDINIDYFGTDPLLYYISQRGREALTAAVKKFPDLEELHLVFMAFISLEDVEAISISCPKLKSFTFSVTNIIRPWESRHSIVKIDDSYALRIAKNMPNLRYLCFSGIRLSNEGRKAFFDNCPNLDSFPL